MAFVPVYILILIATIIIDYYAGIFIEDYPRHRKTLLLISIIANAGTLCVFKYYNFINENITFLLYHFSIKNQIPYLRILLPLGLSFHTFQAMSYTIEVCRGNQKAERHLGIYALYVMFYPQLVAGPIERPQNMLHQFHEKVVFEYDRTIDGLRQMLWGFVKKVVIADRLAIYADAIFSNATHHGWKSSVLAAVFYTFRIYCDFSAYSDIALGSARVLGIKLMVNFNFPLHSKSITEYWRRWHISLSTWLSDYLFTPVITGLRNWGKGAVVFGLFFTFFVSGIWHGAGWNFIIWGLIHGFAVTYEFLTKKIRKKAFSRLPQWVNDKLSVLITFSYVTFGMIFFGASSVHNAIDMVKNIVTLKPGPLFIGNAAGLVYSFLLILFLIASEINEKALNNRYSVLYNKNYLIRLTGYVTLILLIMTIGVFSGSQFIYFQF